MERIPGARSCGSLGRQAEVELLFAELRVVHLAEAGVERLKTLLVGIGILALPKDRLALLRVVALLDAAEVLLFAILMGRRRFLDGGRARERGGARPV